MRYLTILLIAVLGCKEKKDPLIQNKEYVRLNSTSMAKRNQLDGGTIEYSLRRQSSSPLQIDKLKKNNNTLEIDFTNASINDVDSAEIVVLFYGSSNHINGSNGGQSYITLPLDKLIMKGDSDATNWHLNQLNQATGVDAYVKRVHFLDGKVWTN